jgi:alpha-D-ribose 1-methylphosphonate 5-triphosphate diphosphatase
MEGADNAEEYGQQMADYALRAGIPLASHDDEDAEKIRRRHAQGARISEFPLSFDAGRAALELGMDAIVGSPNVMRGGSTGTGESALALIGEGYANCLCSDYAPSTLLPATFQVARDLGWPLHRAARLVTTNPAHAAELPDRGEIAVGKRADLISVHEHHGAPTVQNLWSRGRLSLRFA